MGDVGAMRDLVVEALVAVRAANKEHRSPATVKAEHLTQLAADEAMDLHRWVNPSRGRQAVGPQSFWR